MQAILYSGSGNLLWVVEIKADVSPLINSSWSEFAIELCREQGDGVMLVTEKEPYQACFFNPDGSDGVFCGNGVRCVAFHLAQKYRVYTQQVIIAGQKVRCEVIGEEVRIELPKSGVRSLGPLTLKISADLTLTGCRMDMPNPHWVIFGEITEAELKKIGPLIAELCDDYGGINVEFLFKNAQNEWQALVYERGVGVTQACGSGAMAILCVLQNEHLVPVGQPLVLHMSGGALVLQDLGTHLSLQGQVQLVKEKIIHAS